LAREFSNLSDDIKTKYGSSIELIISNINSEKLTFKNIYILFIFKENKQSYYNFGWSHGKEKLQGKPDVSKGSFYANPQYDEPETDPDLIKKYPAFLHPNIWPKDNLPELEVALKDLGQLIVNTGILVAKQCDQYVNHKCPSYSKDKLTNIIKTSKCCKVINIII